MLAHMKATNQERYQVDFPLQSTAIQEKSQQTLTEIYKAPNAMQNPRVADKAKRTKKIRKLLAEGKQVFGVAKYRKE
jgi:hypothetical protein